MQYTQGRNDPVMFLSGFYLEITETILTKKKNMIATLETLLNIVNNFIVENWVQDMKEKFHQVLKQIMCSRQKRNFLSYK